MYQLIQARAQTLLSLVRRHHTHVFSGHMDVDLHLITPQQRGAEHTVIVYSFFELSIAGVLSACLAGVVGQREKEGFN